MTRAALTASAVTLMVLFAGPAGAKSQSGFVAAAIKGDTSEIALGQLALTRSGDAGVKTFAQALVNDHTTAKAEATSLAQTLGVAAPSGVTTEAEQEHARLQALSGAAFDKEFVRFMIADHEKDIAEFRQEAATGAAPTKDLAAKTLPTLEKHLQMARALAGAK